MVLASHPSPSHFLAPISMMDIAVLLERGQSPTAEVRNEAEAMLRRLEAENYPAYLLSLCSVFNNSAIVVGTQRLAAIILKNTLQSKDAVIKATMKTKWTEVDIATRREIHGELLRGLHNAVVDVCCTVSMVISTVASIDLPRNEWTDLIPALLRNMEMEPIRVSLQRSTLETMGYLCEELAEMPEFALPADIVDRMLTAIVRGMTNADVDTSVRLAATRAMLNALDFTEKNFSNQDERNFIMTAVGQAAMCPTSEEVRALGFECLARICQIYYNLMMPYMAQLFKLTVDVIQRDEEDVVKQAIEVWSTICEEEIELAKDLREQPGQQDLVLHNFALQACPSLIPVLLDQLTKQEEDQELDECAWTVAMAAGSCLQLLAETVGNPIVPIVMPYVQANIKKNEGPDDWRFREAATYCFGAILEGPDEKELAPLAVSGLGFLLGAMKDQDPRVRNTTAWTIGRIFEFVPHAELAPSILTPDNIESVVQCLLQAFADRDELHILERVCFAIEKLAEWCQDHSSVSLSSFFKGLIEALLKLAFHPVESHARVRVQVAAFEAINQLVRSANPDSLDLVVQLIPFLSQKLSESLRVQPTESEERVAELQGMICGGLTVVFARLGQSEGHRIQLNQCSGQLFTLLTEVLQVNSSDSTVMEEVMNTLGSLVSAGVNFGSYVRSFVPYLEKGLRNSTDKHAFLSCVGAVSDIFSNLGERMEPYAQTILSILCDTLSSPTARREIKPPILSLLGDICLAIADRFHKFLQVVNNILKQATEMAIQEVPNMDEEDMDYLNQLMLGIIEAYTGIAQGLSTHLAGQFLAEEYETLMKFMSYLARDRTRNSMVSKEAVGLLGDIISKTPRFNPDLSQKGWMERFIQECLDSPKEGVSTAAERTRVVYSCVCS